MHQHAQQNTAVVIQISGQRAVTIILVKIFKCSMITMRWVVDFEENVIEPDNKTELKDLKHISSTEDAKFMFHMTKMIKSTTGATKGLLYKIISEIMKRGNVSFMNSDIVVPSNSNEADNIFNNGKHGLFDNLPCPEVVDVGGHACMRVGGIIVIILRLGEA